jgi:hemoglobin/transferrin/lactoferrin receptor protein
LKAALSKHFRLTSSLTYTFGRIVTDTADTPLDHIPPLFGRTGIEYEKSKLILTAYAEYHGKKSLDDYNVNGEDNIQYATADGTPGWVTFNLGGSYAISKKITLQSSLENILDTHYRVFASGISAPGRNFVIAVRAEF